MYTIADRINLMYLRLRTCITEKRRWKPVSGIGSPKVYYGVEIPSKSEYASGGIIKLQDLAVIYPNTPESANILYLVSSALPYHPDIIVNYAKKAGVKIVLNQNGVAYPAWYGEGWDKANQGNKYVIQNADYVFYQSNFCKRAADEFVSKISCPHEILYNPVDTDVFAPNGAKDVSGMITILLAGSHIEYYRVESAVNAFKSIINKSCGKFKFKIAGKYKWRRNEQEALSELRSLIHDKGLEKLVEISGAYSQNEAVQLMNSAHILIHTKHNDPCPRLVVEAMACGLPVVYSETGGVTELVGDKAGVGVKVAHSWTELIPPDPDKMADAVMKTTADYNTFSLAARKRAVEMFNVRSWLDRHKNIFEQVLK